MDRKAFLGACAASVCACTAGNLVSASTLTSGAADNEDWRLRFVKKRYAKLLQILSERMSPKDLDQTLHDLGSFCASGSDQTTIKYRGDFEGLRKQFLDGVSKDDVAWDKEKAIITMTSEERADCFCPLNSKPQKTPAVVCNCSLGWQQHTWETFLQRKVRVELKEAVLRGGKRCVFEIHIGEPV